MHIAKVRYLVHRDTPEMSDTKRLNTTIDRRLAERLEKETKGRTPRLPKRYVVELALKRLFEAVDQGQLELELGRNGWSSR